MPENNGYVAYTLLVEYSSRTGQPTGRAKPNDPSDPDYIAPFYDPDQCPLGPPIVPMMNILVDIFNNIESDSDSDTENDYNVTCILNFGTGSIDRNQNGIWTVTKRTYDSVVFQVDTAPVSPYILRIEYGANQVVEIRPSGTGSFLIIGPFVDITKLQLIPDGGDYNSDYDSDFLIG